MHKQICRSEAEICGVWSQLGVENLELSELVWTMFPRMWLGICEILCPAQSLNFL